MSAQLPLFSQDPTPYTVTAITHYIQTLFDADTRLQEVWISGEVSNFKQAPSGHLYFSLKDDTAQLKCVMWRSAAERLRFSPKHGDQVIVSGRIGVYDAQGVYQLYAETMQPAGIGDLNRQFEILKAKLDAEGLFASERKRPLPSLPQKIGIVTSPSAAAFQDVLNVLRRRYPIAQIILSPTLVQGETAPPQIVRALQLLNTRQDIDVILLVRGGGSLEDLWCFNDENVVRAVAGSPVPVITGVGHEIDFTLVDFAADHRAPTPSAAAEIATPDYADLVYTVSHYQERLTQRLDERLAMVQQTLETQTRALRWFAPSGKINNLRQRLDEQAQRLASATRQNLQNQRQSLALLQSRLHSASPQAILERGYALVHREADGKRLTSSQDAAPGTSIIVQLQDGQLAARVKERSTS